MDMRRINMTPPPAMTHSIKNRKILIDKLLELTDIDESELLHKDGWLVVWRELKIKMINDSID